MYTQYNAFYNGMDVNIATSWAMWYEHKPKAIINHKDFYIYHTLNAEWDVDDDNRVDAVLYNHLYQYISGIVFKDVRG